MAVLDVAGALTRKQEEVAELQHRILAIERDAVRLEASVRELVALPS